MLNNPVNASDPSGHKCVGEPDECLNEKGKPINGAGGFSGGNTLSWKPGDESGSESPCDGMVNCPAPPIEDVIQELIGLSNDDVCQFFHLQPGICDSRTWKDFSNITITYIPTNWRQWWIDTLVAQSIILQDIATSISTFGAGFEAAAILGGCSVGGAFGCGAGWVAGVTTYASTLNIFETAFSGASLLTTLAADGLDGGGFFNESSRTSIVTAAVGAAVPDAILDAGIDIYASGYNHGIYCGISTVFVC